MGSLLHIPVAEGICEADFISWARKNGYEIAVTCLENADSLYQTDLQGPVAVVVGSEAGGCFRRLAGSSRKKSFYPDGREGRIVECCCGSWNRYV